MKTLNGDPFILKDYPGKVRVIVLGTQNFIHKLSVCDVWLIDGTFKMCPLNLPKFIPSMVCTGPGGAIRVLLSAFKERKALCISLFIVCDFEIAAIKACKSVYNISISMFLRTFAKCPAV